MLLIELQCFKVLPFSCVWIVLVVKFFGKTLSCLKKQTGLMEETSPVYRIMSFPVQLLVCHKRRGVTGQLYWPFDFLWKTLKWKSVAMSPDSIIPSRWRNGCS